MTPRASRWRTSTGVLTAGLIAGLIVAGSALAGCSKSSGGSMPVAGPMAPTAGGRADAADAPPGGNAENGGGKPGEPQPAPAPVTERSLIYTGSMSVRVDNVVKAADQAVDLAIGMGGLVGADQRNLDSSRSEATLTLRVPADKFSSALDQLAKLGTEESRSINTEDVTEAVVDLEARLATQRASVERVRALLAKANTIGEVVSIESELTRREADLASLEQRKQRLADLVALSTITLHVLGPDATITPTEPETGFVAGLKDGWKAFLDSVKVLLTVAGYLLPWIIAITVPIWLLVWILRRPRRFRGGAAPAISSPPPPAG